MLHCQHWWTYAAHSVHVWMVQLVAHNQHMEKLHFWSFSNFLAPLSFLFSWETWSWGHHICWCWCQHASRIICSKHETLLQWWRASWREVSRMSSPLNSMRWRSFKLFSFSHSFTKWKLLWGPTHAWATSIILLRLHVCELYAVEVVRLSAKYALTFLSIKSKQRPFVLDNHNFSKELISLPASRIASTEVVSLLESEPSFSFLQTSPRTWSCCFLIERTYRRLRSFLL